MRLVGIALRFLIFLLLAPLFAAITLLIIVAGPDLLFRRRNREDLRYFWANLWEFVIGEEG